MQESIREVHTTKALSSSAIVELIDKYPDLEVITCSPSVYERTPKNYIDALEKLDIRVEKKYEWGAKSKTEGVEFEVMRLSNQGLKPREIADELDITLNRIYYLLKKSRTSFDNRKRKHDHTKVKELKEEGLSAREISERLDVPLRSVYYILNNK